jgi:AbiU2
MPLAGRREPATGRGYPLELDRADGGYIMRPHTAMPEEVEKLFVIVHREVTTLHAYSDALQEFFGKPESIEAIKELVPGIFVLIMHAFRHEIIMSCCRITDRKATSGKENLTLKQLLYVLGDHIPDKRLLARLAALEKEIDDHCEPIRTLRNRTVGHLDLKTALELHPEALPDVDREHVNEALRLLGEFMTAVLDYYRPGTEVDFIPTLTGPPSTLTCILKNFKKYQEAYSREERRRLLGE